MLSEAVRGIIARGAFAAALSIAAGVLSACASTSYAGIPLTAGAADAELQDLARRAQAEDKHAQLELGIRYEEGRGVAPDFRRASKLYRSAATTTALSTSYSLPQGRGGSTSAGVLYSGAVSAGLPYALARFCSLEVPRTERESVLCKKARPEDVDEVLLVASYEVNFAGCTRKVKFGPFSRNEFRAVRNCLVQESRASRCEQDLATALRKVQALVWGTGRLAHLRQPARVLTEVCPGTHRQFEARKLAEGEVAASISPLDALLATLGGEALGAARQPGQYESFNADTFLRLMCRLTPQELGLSLTPTERVLCGIYVEGNN